jgi:hypothetical protein
MFEDGVPWAGPGDWVNPIHPLFVRCRVANEVLNRILPG